jgi:two-component system LytT family sensor kinase
MTVDVEFLRNVAVIVGRRLEALAREADRVERAHREAQLVHQVVSAELRALRAQLSPHFLFNVLNTIAALIPHEPEKAELMVVRLAKVFRHLLAHSEKSFSSLQEEIEFLRTYLEIEKVRFGERLTVEFEISEAAAMATVPSLILQPLVENSLKHGLAPKRGDNRLIIRAGWADGALSLSVEDNGVGISKALNSGVGLRNIRERLRTTYGDRASLVLENIAQGGSRASVIIPSADTV